MMLVLLLANMSLAQILVIALSMHVVAIRLRAFVFYRFCQLVERAPRPFCLLPGLSWASESIEASSNSARCQKIAAPCPKIAEIGRFSGSWAKKNTDAGKAISRNPR